MLDTLIVTMACGRPAPRITPKPPAPIVVRTGCGTFAIGVDGAVRRHTSSSVPSWAPGAVSHPSPGVWVAHPRGRLAVYRNGRLLWESRVRHGTDNVAVAGKTIAFSVGGSRTPTSLWMAQVREVERKIARGEEPVGWTANGLITQRRDEIRVRVANGRLIRVVAHGHGPVYDAFDRTVLLVSRSGSVVRTDGRHVWRLARGFRSNSWLQLLGSRVIDVTTGMHSVFLRSDGSRLGVTAPLDEPAAAMGAVVALPDDGGIVYVVRRRLRADNPGVNRVYVARPDRQPRLLYTRRIPRLSCGEYTSLSYANRRILYDDDEGPLAILDPYGRARPIDLTTALRVLQPRRTDLEQLSADWLSNWG